MTSPEQAHNTEQLQRAGYRRLPNGTEVWVDEDGTFEVPIDDPVLRGFEAPASFANEAPSYKITIELNGQGHPAEAIRSLSGHAALQPVVEQPQQVEGPKPRYWSLATEAEMESFDEYDNFSPTTNNHLDYIPPVKDRESEVESPKPVVSSFETEKPHRRRPVALIGVLIVGLVVVPPAVRVFNGGETAAQECGFNPLCLGGKMIDEANPLTNWPFGGK